MVSAPMGIIRKTFYYSVLQRFAIATFGIFLASIPSAGVAFKLTLEYLTLACNSVALLSVPVHPAPERIMRAAPVKQTKQARPEIRTTGGHFGFHRETLGKEQGSWLY